MGGDGSGSYSDILAGIDWVLNRPERPGVVNLSIGGPRSLILNDAIEDLYNAGFSVVTSAGRSSQAGEPFHGTAPLGARLCRQKSHMLFPAT